MVLISPYLKGYPKSETELLLRCQAIAGLSFLQLASHIGVVIPEDPNQRKGWAGQAIEIALGAEGGNQARPDFNELGIELKTIPVNEKGQPIESTFITSIPLLTIHRQTWQTSTCFAKLKRVLWVPVEGDVSIPFEARRIGLGVLWSPTSSQSEGLSADWEELTMLVSTGRLEEIHAGIGDYLQIRPKAAHGKSLCYGYDAEGNKVSTLPRGFYLRRSFTGHILSF